MTRVWSRGFTLEAGELRCRNCREELARLGPRVAAVAHHSPVLAAVLLVHRDRCPAAPTPPAG